MGCCSISDRDRIVLIKDTVENRNCFRHLPSDFIVENPHQFKKIYSVGKSLGSGSFGEVKQVYHKITRQERAVKIFKVSDKDNTGLSEINILKSLDHPSIIKVYEYFQDFKKVYMIIEKCNGGELFHEILKRQHLSEACAAVIIKQLLSVVSYLHENQVVHRDIKPENILLEDQHDFLNIKLIDFGEATFFTKGKKMTGLVGSVYYLAPEVIKGSYTEICDEWSCGVILYILLSGVPPFPGKNYEEITSNIKSGSYLLEGLIWDHVSAQAKDLIAKLLCPYKHRITAEEALSHEWIIKNANYPPADPKAIESILNRLKNFHTLNKIAESIKCFISSQVVSTQETKTLRELFKSIDKNGDGKLSLDEIGKVLGKVEEDVVDKIMTVMDNDQSGFIDYNEFLRGCLDDQLIYRKENLKSAFDMLDLDNSGKISLEEVKNVLCLGEMDTEIEEFIKEADKNFDGEIDFDEFCKFLYSIFDTE